MAIRGRSSRICSLYVLLMSSIWVEAFVLLALPTSKRVSCASHQLRSSSNNDDLEHADQNTAMHADFLGLLMPSSDCKVDQMSSTDLAYIGDAVYELMVRSRTVWPSKKTSHLQNEVVGLVRAEHQSILLGKLRQHFNLTGAEQQVLSRGRNASTSSSKNRRNPAAYQNSTALEALVGYLFITDTHRCQELLQWIHANIDETTA